LLSLIADFSMKYLDYHFISTATFLIVEVRVVMKKMNILLTAVLAAMVLTMMTGAFSIPQIGIPQLNMFKVPTLTTGSTGFSQLSTSDVGTTPIIFAPSQSLLMNGGGVNAHYTPFLQTSSWGSSMKTSGVNQMFMMMEKGLAKKSS